MPRILPFSSNMDNSPNHLRISFPALVVHETKLLPCTKREFLRHDYAGMDRGKILTKNGSNPKMQIPFLLDSSGLLWRLERLGTRRVFLRWLAPLIDFTLAEYRIEPGLHLTTDELLTHVGPLKSIAGFRDAGHLKGFLRKHPGCVFDKVLFREFWEKHGFELKAPDFWGETLEV